MQLRVVHQDGQYYFVSDSMLTSLIEFSEITKFKRSDGWVDIDSRHVRRTSRQYIGPEKRSNLIADPPSPIDADSLF